MCAPASFCPRSSVSCFATADCSCGALGSAGVERGGALVYAFDGVRSVWVVFCFYGWERRFAGGTLAWLGRAIRLEESRRFAERCAADRGEDGGFEFCFFFKLVQRSMYVGTTFPRWLGFLYLLCVWFGRRLRFAKVFTWWCQAAAS